MLRKFSVYTFCFLYVFLYAFTPERRAFSNSFLSNTNDTALSLKPNKNVNPHKLIYAYPDFLSFFSNNMIYWHDGTSMLWNDLKKKTISEKLTEPDLEDQFFFAYSKTFPKDSTSYPPSNHDPGRIRYEPFFKKMYGSNKKQIRQNITAVKWMPRSTSKTVYVTQINGVDKKVKKISLELDNLPNHLKKYVINPGGSWIVREIVGTSRLSTHSFGIAIDISVNYSSYWRWADGTNELRYKNQIPRKIVEIFEKYGFIWGGKWYHYDTMHFEYRPEILLKL